MAFFTDEDYARIISAITAKAGVIGRCELCGQQSHTLVDGIVTLPLIGEHANTIAPSVALVCNHCGKTTLINIVMLGLRDLAIKYGALSA